MTNGKTYGGPLKGLNVVDFGHYYAGPMAAMLMADQGANVVRVVKPGEPELISEQYRVLNRNKKILTLDLKTEEGLAQAKELVEKADVLIENFRPGVMDRLGLGYKTVETINPRLVYLSLPGFPSTDKERAHIQAWEGIMNAAACTYTESHWWRQKLGFPPLYSWVPMCSAHGSMQGAIAVMAALVHREENGKGNRIEVSQIAAAISGISPAVFVKKEMFPVRTADGAMIDAFKPLVFDPSDDEETQLDKLDRVTREFPMGPVSKSYHCADGREIMLWGGADKVVKALGITKKLKEANIDYTNWFLPAEQKGRFIEIVSEAMLQKTSDEWDEILGAVPTPASLIRTREEWMSLEPMMKAGMFSRMGNGKDEITVPGQFADVSGPGGALVSNDFSEPEIVDFGAATAFLQEMQKPALASGAQSAPNKGDLLKGLKVLDLTNLVAGPTSTYTLAQYGAEVIKADRPNTTNVGLVALSMLEVNQGKRSILMDLGTGPGRKVFHDLVRWADVVVHNSVDDVMERLGATLEDLQQINPDVIACQFSAYGSLYRGVGGWEKRPGYDPNAQCVSGMMAHYGTLEKPQAHGMISCGDIMGGIGGTFAALLGVYQKRKTGHAGEARSSLARMINYIQLPGMIAKGGNCDWGEPRGQFTFGPKWSQRMYACSDRWIYVHAADDKESNLLALMPEVNTGDETALAEAFAGNNSDYWLEKLTDAGIACHPVLSMSDITEAGIEDVDNDEAVVEAKGSVEILRRLNHPSGEAITFIAPTWTRVGEKNTYQRLTPALRYGQHSREILAEIGYSEDDIDKLVHIKAVHEFVPLMGSKDKYFFEPTAE